MEIKFGKNAESIENQLATAGYYVDNCEDFQLSADSIVRLEGNGLLHWLEVDKARRMLTKDITSAIQKIEKINLSYSEVGVLNEIRVKCRAIEFSYLHKYTNFEVTNLIGILHKLLGLGLIEDVKGCEFGESLFVLTSKGIDYCKIKGESND